MSQARTPTKRAAAASTTQTPTGSRGSKAARSADDGGRDKDDDDVRRDMTAEFDNETKTGDAEGAVAETEAERASPAPAPPRQSAPLAASRAYPPFFREAGRVGRSDSSTIRIAHVQLMTRGEPNANPSPALYMSGYGLADLFESFASTASKDAVDKRKSLRTIWNGMSRTDRILFTLTNCACLRYVPVLLPPGRRRQAHDSRQDLPSMELGRLPRRTPEERGERGAGHDYRYGERGQAHRILVREHDQERQRAHMRVRRPQRRANGLERVRPREERAPRRARSEEGNGPGLDGVVRPRLRFRSSTVTTPAAPAVCRRADAELPRIWHRTPGRRGIAHLFRV